jgi:hypothetical protein
MENRLKLAKTFIESLVKEKDAQDALMEGFQAMLEAEEQQNNDGALMIDGSNGTVAEILTNIQETDPEIGSRMSAIVKREQTDSKKIIVFGISGYSSTEQTAEHMSLLDASKKVGEFFDIEHRTYTRSHRSDIVNIEDIFKLKPILSSTEKTDKGYVATTLFIGTKPTDPKSSASRYATVKNISAFTDRLFPNTHKRLSELPEKLKNRIDSFHEKNNLSFSYHFGGGANLFDFLEELDSVTNGLWMYKGSAPIFNNPSQTQAQTQAYCWVFEEISGRSGTNIKKIFYSVRYDGTFDFGICTKEGLEENVHVETYSGLIRKLIPEVKKYTNDAAVSSGYDEHRRIGERYPELTLPLSDRAYQYSRTQKHGINRTDARDHADGIFRDYIIRTH